MRYRSFEECVRAGHVAPGAGELPRNGRFNVLWVAGDRYQSCYYRCYLPCVGLQRHSARFNARVTHMVTQELIDWAHVIVWQHQDRYDLADTFAYAKKAGKRNVYETDDNLHAPDETNPYYHEMAARPVHYRCQWLWMNMCDAMVVSTEALKEWYGRRVNKEPEAIRNAVDVAGWARAAGERGRFERVRIVWAGGTSHLRDLRLLAEPVRELKRMYGNEVKVMCMGFDGRIRLPDGEGGERWHDAGVAWDYCHPGTTLDRFHGELRRLSPDIGLAPLDTETAGEFNACKSNLKWMDYALAGAATVASEAEPYGHDGMARWGLGVEWRAGATGVVCENSPDAWLAAVGTLVEDAELRWRMAEMALARVRERYDIDVVWREWERVLWRVLREGA